MVDVIVATVVELSDCRLELMTWEMTVGRLGTVGELSLSRMHVLATAVLGRHILVGRGVGRIGALKGVPCKRKALS